MRRSRGRVRVGLLIIRRSYTLKELSATLNIHVRTVQAWHREGMKPIDNSTRPFLFLGGVVAHFVRARAQKRKCKLGLEEFYCHKCKCPRKSERSQMRSERTGRKLGRWKLQVLVRGVCAVCGSKLARLAAETTVELQEQVSD